MSHMVHVCRCGHDRETHRLDADVEAVDPFDYLEHCGAQDCPCERFEEEHPR